MLKIPFAHKAIGATKNRYKHLKTSEPDTNQVPDYQHYN